MRKHKNIIMLIITLIVTSVAVITAKKKIKPLEFKSFPSEEIRNMNKIKLNFYRLNNMLAFKGYKELFKKDTYRTLKENKGSIGAVIFALQYATYFVVLADDTSEVF